LNHIFLLSSFLNELGLKPKTISSNHFFDFLYFQVFFVTGFKIHSIFSFLQS